MYVANTHTHVTVIETNWNTLESKVSYENKCFELLGV